MLVCRFLTRLRDLTAALLGPAPAGNATASRSYHRYRRAAITGLSMAGARGVQLVAVLVTVPILLHHLGPERYGLLASIISLVAVFGFADLGLGNGVVNAVANRLGRDQATDVRSVVSTAVILLGALAGLAMVVFLLASPQLPLAGVLGLTSASNALDAQRGVLVVVACLLANLPTGLVHKVFLGFQEGFLSHILLAAGSLATILAVVIFVRLEAPFVAFVAAYSAPAVLASLVGWMVLRFKHPTAMPSLRAFRRGEARSLLTAGGFFFLLQFVAGVGFAADNLVIAYKLGAAAVPSYAVPAQLFRIAPLVLGMAISPLWPAYAEASARGEPGWVRRAYLRSLYLSAGVGVFAAAVLVPAGNWLVALWTADEITPTTSLLTGLAVWTVSYSMGSAAATVLNGIGELPIHALFGVLVTVVGLLLRVYAADRWRVAGVTWAAAGSHAVLYSLPLVVFALRKTRCAPWGASSTEAASDLGQRGCHRA